MGPSQLSTVNGYRDSKNKRVFACNYSTVEILLYCKYYGDGGGLLCCAKSFFFFFFTKSSLNQTAKKDALSLLNLLTRGRSCSSLQAYLEPLRTLCAARRVDSAGAVRLTGAFNHTNLLPGALRRLGDILGTAFGRLRRKHVRASLLALMLIFTCQRAKVRSFDLLLEISTAQRQCALHWKLMFLAFQLWRWFFIRGGFMIGWAKTSSHDSCMSEHRKEKCTWKEYKSAWYAAGFNDFLSEINHLRRKISLFKAKYI